MGLRAAPRDMGFRAAPRDTELRAAPRDTGLRAAPRDTGLRAAPRDTGIVTVILALTLKSKVALRAALIPSSGRTPPGRNTAERITHLFGQALEAAQTKRSRPYTAPRAGDAQPWSIIIPNWVASGRLTLHPRRHDDHKGLPGEWTRLVVEALLEDYLHVGLYRNWSNVYSGVYSIDFVDSGVVDLDTQSTQAGLDF